MAASQIAIVNLALLELGQAPIAALNEGTTAAQTMSLIYNLVRQELLRKYRWGFSRKQANLASVVTDPIWNYTHAFNLPSDFMQLIGVKTVDGVDPTYTLLGVPATYPAYRIYGRQLLINQEGPLYIEYSADISDTSLFDAAFVTAFALALASRAAQRITQSNTVSQAVEAKYQQAIREAIRANAIEVPPTASPATSYTVSRVNGG